MIRVLICQILFCLQNAPVIQAIPVVLAILLLAWRIVDLMVIVFGVNVFVIRVGLVRNVMFKAAELVGTAAVMALVLMAFAFVILALRVHSAKSVSVP